MKKTYSILLLGLLSMLFAEIFSGASQLWFFSAWGWIVGFPLYLMHTVFLLYLALRTKKVTISQLYLFGMIFGLYEALITKVLWVGYFNEAGPAWGTFLGLAVAEFPVLVFFWHPIFSLILPILTYEILTQTIVIQHHNTLSKTRKKNIIIGLGLVSVSAFIVNGNQYDILSANGAFIGSVFLVWLVFLLLKKEPNKISEIIKIKVLPFVIGLIVLYGVTFAFLLPERIPQTATPYLSILAFYVIAILLLIKTKKSELIEESISSKHYGRKDLMFGILCIIVFVNILIWIPAVNDAIVFVFYLVYLGVGTLLFVMNVFKILVNKKTKQIDSTVI